MFHHIIVNIITVFQVCICCLMVAITVMITTSRFCDANPIYETWDPREITEEDMNKPTKCESDVSIDLMLY